MEKVCRTCGILKSIDEYYVHKQMGDGHLNICKECIKKNVNNHRELNIEKIREYDRNRPNKRERSKRDAEKKRLLKANDYEKYREQEYNRTKTDRARNPEKYKARCVINNSIRDGKIKKLPCSVCGNEKSQAHHDDYSNPLEVIWLCSKHHAERHVYLRNIERNKI